MAIIFQGGITMIEQDNKNTNEHMESNNTNSSHEDAFEKLGE